VGTPLSRTQLCEHPKLEHVLVVLVGLVGIIDGVGTWTACPKILGVPEGCGSKQNKINKGLSNLIMYSICVAVYLAYILCTIQLIYYNIDIYYSTFLQ
jgi:hypothetical protein